MAQGQMLWDSPILKRMETDREDLRHLNLVSLHRVREFARATTVAPNYLQSEPETLRLLTDSSDDQLEVVAKALHVDVSKLLFGDDIEFWSELSEIDVHETLPLINHAARHLRKMRIASTEIENVCRDIGRQIQFHDVNMKILLRARRLARDDSNFASLNLEMRDDVAARLAEWTDHRLISVARSYPLLLAALRGGRNTKIWKRIFMLREDDRNAAKVLGDHLMMMGIAVPLQAMRA